MDYNLYYKEEEVVMKLIRNYIIFTVFSLTALGVSAQEVSKDNSKEVTCLDENFDWNSVDATDLKNPVLKIVNPGEGPKFPVQLKYKASKGNIESTNISPGTEIELHLEFAYDLEPIGSGNKANIDITLVKLTWDQKVDQISQEQEKQIESALEKIRNLRNIVYSYTLTEAGQWVDFRKKSGEITAYDKMIDFSKISKLFLFGVPKQVVGKNAKWYLASVVDGPEIEDERNSLRYCAVYTVKKISEKEFEIKQHATSQRNYISDFGLWSEVSRNKYKNSLSSTSKIDLEEMTVEQKTSGTLFGMDFTQTTKMAPSPDKDTLYELLDFSL
jgi:hypothetical protein